MDEDGRNTAFYEDEAFELRGKVKALREALSEAREALWNALDHLDVDDPDEAADIKAIDAVLGAE